jgi:CheY-like chemotaxis protein
MPREGGILGIRTENVVVDPEYCQRNPQAREGPCVRLTASDTGKGMDEETKARLFEPFYTTKEADRGTGLGLAVVYGIVQSHEGWVTVESRPDWGSRFEIYLPALVSEAGAAGPSRERETGESGGGGRERILLVEDEAELRERMAGVLGHHSYSVRACGTAAEARQAFHREDGRFDLLLSDVVLPDGRGPELASGFLAEQPGLAVLMVTGHTGEAADWDYIRDADLSFLPKPFSVAQLLREVRQVLAP